eukprot:Nitzschia sp. Nitz4//scaffold5_size260463//76517//77023//NITZ4_000964-RA/size260463-processed-gene-0.307-mRNA-1//1//CDS//3329555286//8818//frame0
MNRSDHYSTSGDESSSEFRLSTSSSVSFGPIQIREYERILTAEGQQTVGLELGWAYEEFDSTDIDDYENSVAKCNVGGPLPRTPEERLRILNRYGYSVTELTLNEENRLNRENANQSVAPRSVGENNHQRDTHHRHPRREHQNYPSVMRRRLGFFRRLRSSNEEEWYY